MIVIPFQYNEMSAAEQAKTIPICVDAHDNHGAEIDRRWFFEGVAPVYKFLLRCAQRVLGDPLRASEITERAVHALWKRHGSNLGACPPAQVTSEAKWAAKKVRSNEYRQSTKCSEYCNEWYTAEDRTDYERVYIAKLDLDLILERMQAADEDVAMIANALLSGVTYEELAAQLGIKANTLVVKLYRWRKENCAKYSHGITGRRPILEIADASDSDAIPES